MPIGAALNPVAKDTPDKAEESRVNKTHQAAAHGEGEQTTAMSSLCVFTLMVKRMFIQTGSFPTIKCVCLMNPSRDVKLPACF